MKLVICDDDLNQHQWVDGALKRWSEAAKEPIETLKYTSAEALLFGKEDWAAFDGLLLDIEMKAMNGMALAKEIRTFDAHIPILFLTGFEDYVFEGYEVGAISYLLKPINEDKLANALHKVWEASRKNSDVLFVDTKEGVEKIYLNEILYIESDKHNSKVVTVRTELLSVQGIGKYVETLAEKGFVITHRSFLANIRRIKKITKSDVHLDNGATVPIARGKWGEVNQSYLDFHRKG